MLGSGARVVAPGSVIGDKYEIVSLIGEGGMGVVYEARHTRIARRVAIKVIHPSMARDSEALARFEREADAVSRIGSQHVVDVLDFGNLEGGDRFIVMEYLEGETLGARLKREGFLTQSEVFQIGVQILEGLVRVHEAGIIHRDLKPGNIFLASRLESPVVKILDFGVCKMQETQGDGEPLTTMGQLLGTPAYMSPETMQLGPSNADARSDLYSVGMILRRALAGRLPYEADSIVELLVRRREEKPLPLARVSPDVDPELAAIVDRAIAAEPEDRFQTAAEFKRALVDWSTGIDIDVEHETRRISLPPPDVDDEAATLPLRGSVPKPRRQ